MRTAAAGNKSLDDRVTELEFLFTHLERQLGEVNRVVLEQADRLEDLQRELRNMCLPPLQPDDDVGDEG